MDKVPTPRKRYKVRQGIMVKKIPYKNFVRDFNNLYGEHFRVYGPYLRGKRDMRAIVIIVEIVDGKKISLTKTYSKVKLEIKLKRILGKSDLVRHIDNNYTNDKFSNLQLSTHLKSVSSSSLEVDQEVFEPYVCIYCKEKMFSFD